MRIVHIALWTNQLDEMKNFYETYFDGVCNEKYTNQSKGFESYFITFEGDVSLEIMRRIDIQEQKYGEYIGICHLAFGLKDREALIDKTEQIRSNGFRIVGEPRITGDGYFESVILDLDGNRIELVAESI